MRSLRRGLSMIERATKMKWRQRLVLFGVAMGACLVTMAFFPGLLERKETFRMDRASVGDAAAFKHNVDIYPGKLRKSPGYLSGVQRELQGKSRSETDASPDREEKGNAQDVDQPKALVDDDSPEGKQIQMLENIIKQVSPDHTAMGKLFKAVYLIANESLGPDVLEQFMGELEKAGDKTTLQELKMFLQNRDLTKSDSGVERKRPDRVIVTAKELQRLQNVVPKDVRWSDRGSVKHKKKLHLTRAQMMAAWDGKPLSKHWRDFYTNINSVELFPDPSKSSIADDIAYHLATEDIIGVENLDGGTQIKLLFYLRDGGKAVFKPMRVTREKETDPNIFYWRDYERANAEVAAFHLDKALDMRRSSPCASRVINITSQIWALADKDLASTIFVSPGKNICFHAKCDLYCDGAHAVCGSPDTIYGSFCAWLPKVKRSRVKSPWRRSYSKWQKAEWERDPKYCDKKVKVKRLYSETRRLLDITDMETFDFIMYNMDRHHNEWFQQFGNETFLLNIDNGRGFGTHSADELSILAPVYQCCVYRYSMLQKLLKYHVGPVHLGEEMRRRMRHEAMHPVLIDEHFEAIDRRVNHTLKAVAECVRQHGAKHVVFNDGF